MPKLYKLLSLALLLFVSLVQFSSAQTHPELEKKKKKHKKPKPVDPYKDDSIDVRYPLHIAEAFYKGIILSLFTDEDYEKKCFNTDSRN
jgi:hypothetical protein